MTRRAGPDHEEGNDSSFLDVITNCVGILIILVIVVGQRAKNAPVLVAARESALKLAEARAAASAMEEQAARTSDLLRIAQTEVAARGAERNEVNTLVSAIEQELAARRAGMDEETRRRYDLDRDLALARAELSRLEHQRDQAGKVAAPKIVTVESYPTPIGKTVEGKEAHFQLLGGRLVYVPFDAFIEKVKDRLQELARSNDDHGETSDVLGPIGGFRMRYSLEKLETPRGVMAQVSHIEMIPSSSQLGEPIDAALATRSQLREKLKMLSPHQYTITVWTYPDSFAEYRKLKKELFELGYQVAARPLLEGMPIAASPYGSKSSAQ